MVRVLAAYAGRHVHMAAKLDAEQVRTKLLLMPPPARFSPHVGMCDVMSIFKVVRDQTRPRVKVYKRQHQVAMCQSAQTPAYGHEKVYTKVVAMLRAEVVQLAAQ